MVEFKNKKTKAVGEVIWHKGNGGTTTIKTRDGEEHILSSYYVINDWNPVGRIKLSWKDFVRVMRYYTREHHSMVKYPIKGVIVFSNDMFEDDWEEKSRSYRVTSDSFITEEELVADCLDGSDVNVVIPDTWTDIEYCYFESNDILALPII